MEIKTGKGTIPLMTLLAIWSISLVVNLPGLAVTPMLDNLKHILPHTTELEVQLLTVLPNLLIIPFVLLSGKLSLSKSKIAIVVLALAIFLAAAILYLLAKSMIVLILVSCLLGIGAGLLIPLAAGLLADTFIGKYRMRQLGIKSGISNISLVIATYVVGWLSKPGLNWHLPFLVYLIAVIPLLMAFFLKGIPQEDLYPVAGKDKAIDDSDDTAKEALSDVDPTKVKGGFVWGRVWGIFFSYFFIGYATMVFSYYSPFYMEGVGLSSADVGMVTALFFLAIFIPGFCLPYIVRAFKKATFIVCAVFMVIGLFLMVITHEYWVMCVASFVCGFGYGVFQPLIYDKSTYTTVEPKKSTQALSITLTANYVGVMITPFIVEGIQDLFGAQHNQAFPFWCNGVLMVGFLIIVILCRHDFAFRVSDTYYKKDDQSSTPSQPSQPSQQAQPAPATQAAPATTAPQPSPAASKPSQPSQPK